MCFGELFGETDEGELCSQVAFGLVEPVFFGLGWIGDEIPHLMIGELIDAGLINVKGRVVPIPIHRSVDIGEVSALITILGGIPVHAPDSVDGISENREGRNPVLVSVVVIVQGPSEFVQIGEGRTVGQNRTRTDGVPAPFALFFASSGGRETLPISLLIAFVQFVILGGDSAEFVESFPCAFQLIVQRRPPGLHVMMMKDLLGFQRMVRRKDLQPLLFRKPFVQFQ